MPNIDVAVKRVKTFPPLSSLNFFGYPIKPQQYLLLITFFQSVSSIEITFLAFHLNVNVKN
jgi:hypothetical protein